MAHSQSGPTGSSSTVVESYSLKTKDSSKSPPKQSVYLIRMTDASLKSLQDVVTESKRGKSNWPGGYVEIKSGGNNDGVLCFGGSVPREYRFMMLDAQRDLGPNGHLEAIKQPGQKSLAGGIVMSVGSIGKRLQVSASTEDTFESTKQKVKHANEEMRKNTAKVLKGPAGAGVQMKKTWNKIAKAHEMTPRRPLTPLSQVGGTATTAAKTKPVDGKESRKQRSAVSGVSMLTGKRAMVDTAKRDGHHNGNRGNIMTNGENTSRDYRMEYPPVRTLEERQRYKQEFDRDYPLYLEAYEKMQAFAAKFTGLKEELLKSAKGTPERKAVEKELVAMYYQFENDDEIKKSRKEHIQFSQKLKVIKMRVKEFDDAMTMT